MTISYHWLSEYLPEIIEPERLSKILTSIGLEVEHMETYESIKGGLQGLVVGEVIECEQHPNADKLKVTKVNIGAELPLQIVCGANNVAVGQKVVVAITGTTIYPMSGEPLTMQVAKIRGTESHGMICAEDEIGLSANHDGILILPNDIAPGTSVADYFKPYTDIIFEIGLTPNRMDAMSHYGVAKDVCAYLTHQQKKEIKPQNIFSNGLKSDSNNGAIQVAIENAEDCPRYSGISISGITVADSPQWLKDKLTAIGVRCINNIVDVTNYVLHESGQPLHAFDADEIAGKKIIVQKATEGTLFTTLDDKERKLTSNDLMICDGNGKPMCIAGIFGGSTSGVKKTTTNIFLESAVFNAITIRKSSVHHGLRTDAATRFEKGVDISNAINVLKRAAQLIQQVAGGTFSSEVIDVYPDPKPKTEIAIKNHYLKKLSGKNYHADAVKRILSSLGFEILKEGLDELRVAVPYSKPDISLPADIVEEILRIDGLDNIEIPANINITPAVDELSLKENLREKIANYLVGLGFHEIFTNSITNSKYFAEAEQDTLVKMMNNLSADLDVLRPSMLETGLETLSYNINRRNTNLQFFEFGKTYHTNGVGNYSEQEHIVLYITGANHEDQWNEKSQAFSFYTAKGIADALLNLVGLQQIHFENDATKENPTVQISNHQKVLGVVQQVSSKVLNTFDIKQEVFCIDINYEMLLDEVSKRKISYTEVSKFQPVQRDLAMVVNKNITYEAIENAVKKTKNNKLQSIRLFDVFESEKLGIDKKSIAINFTFIDEEKTLTDKEIDTMVNKLIQTFEQELTAEIRK